SSALCTICTLPLGITRPEARLIWSISAQYAQAKNPPMATNAIRITRLRVHGLSDVVADISSSIRHDRRDGTVRFHRLHRGTAQLAQHLRRRAIHHDTAVRNDDHSLRELEQRGL